MYYTRFFKSGLLLAAAMLGLFLMTGAAQGVSAPEFNPEAGGYYTQKAVVVSCATAGATIYYTLDGSVPTTGSSTVVTGGTVLIDRYLTLKAAAWLGGDWSTVTSADYAITGQIAAGDFHAFVLPSTGANVLAFGENFNGQLGIGTSGAGVISSLPVAVM
ncbi:MAG: chitobiase/beta-hexosaminidase C-terminal domain-containing protein [Verrucomicrobiota bacterium]